MNDNKDVDRRGFLWTAGAAGAAMSLSAKSYADVVGANERLGIAFLGVGGRCQAHLDIIKKMAETKKTVKCAGVCDVWDGLEDVYEYEFAGEMKKRNYLQGLRPSAKKMGLDPDDKTRVVKDYRKLLELKDVDAVCIATPDHWHAKMTIDAARAGKAVYCEKPMTKTIEEAIEVARVCAETNTVMTVGVQSMADPSWTTAYDLIKAGKIGHVAQGQTSYYRNDIRGQWRYYRLAKEMNPKTVDWKMFLGTNFEVFKGQPIGPDMPFDRAVFAQWRCYWPFGGGMFTDLFVHQTTHLIAAMGVRFPTRVVGGGGLYLEYDGRDVPDVATVVADYDEGCQLVITATMISSYSIEEVIRGRLGTVRFVRRVDPMTKKNETFVEIFGDDPNKGAGIPARLGDRDLTPTERIKIDVPTNDTEALWENFLDCVRRKDRKTLSPPELGAAAFSTVAMGVQSYKTGTAVFFDKETQKVGPADATWAAKWEKKSKAKAKPNQIIGWKGDDAGSTMKPPAYMKLAGPWTSEKDPTEG
jgi:predicted dehydrogenase